jgi:thiol-disulfide isomerase/thioredoxin
LRVLLHRVSDRVNASRAVDWKGARLSVGRRGGMFGLVRRVVVAVVMVVGVVLLFWAGVHNLRARRAAMEKARATEVMLMPAQAGGDEGAPDGEGASMKGKAAPNFTLVDLAGKKVSLADFKGHPVIVNFWATWCGPCKLEMPWFEQMYGKYKPQGLVILGLSQDDGTAKGDIASAAKKIGVSYPILLPDDSVSKAYGGVDYLPETFYVDAKGKIVEEVAGAPSLDEIDADIRKTIAAGQS